MIHFSVQESQHLLCEVLRNDQCRIVITVLNSFQGFFGSPREYPADSGIGPQSLQHTVSYIQGKSHDLRSGIIGSHRHLQLAGSRRFIGIPVGENIEPCIQCRETTATTLLLIRRMSVVNIFQMLRILLAFLPVFCFFYFFCFVFFLCHFCLCLRRGVQSLTDHFPGLADDLCRSVKIRRGYCFDRSLFPL